MVYLPKKSTFASIAEINQGANMNWSNTQNLTEHLIYSTLNNFASHAYIQEITIGRLAKLYNGRLAQNLAELQVQHVEDERGYGFEDSADEAQAVKQATAALREVYGI